MPAKNVCILGSTGSIGRQSLDVIRTIGGLSVVALAAHSNVGLMFEQISEFQPKLAVMEREQSAIELQKLLVENGYKTEVLYGASGIITAAGIDGADTVINALPGIAGLDPTLAAISAGKNIALANKETLVAGGEIVTLAAQAANVCILPVDSEHSAIFQCLQATLSSGNVQSAEKIYLTASGGPFWRTHEAELEHITPEKALKHPNWTMGKKITIDSATMMNKGLEVIEAKWLFGREIPIDILVHPQSVIHSMVEFRDGAILAQLGTADMRVPIAFALCFPERAATDFPRLDFSKVRNLTFEPPDYARFPCLRLADQAWRLGGTVPAVMNAANEIAVNAFLDNVAKFTDIPYIIEATMMAYNDNSELSAQAIHEAERWSINKAMDIIKNLGIARKKYFPMSE